MMFEPGTQYDFITLDHDGESHWSGTVVEVDGPLLKIDRQDGQLILNSHSPAFKSAQAWSDARHNQARESDASLRDLIAEVRGRNGQIDAA